MTALPDSLLDTLGAVVGSSGLVTEPDRVAPYIVDWRGAHRGDTPAVLRPASAIEVSRAVSLCAEAGVGLVPQGGNTGLCGGAVPDPSRSDAVLSTERMRRIRQVDIDGNRIAVEAGVVLSQVQHAATSAGRTFPLSLGSEGSCTIGGNLATNAGGTGVLRYGMIRDLTLGVEVVLPDGRIWDGMRSLRKDNTGYDLKRLFIGSEGTLGIITAAVLRLVPPTPRRTCAWVALPDVASATSLLGLLREEADAYLSAYELMSQQALDMVLTHVPGSREPLGVVQPWYALIELSAPSRAEGVAAIMHDALEHAVDRGWVSDAVVADGSTQRSRLWALREGVSEAQNHDGPSLKHDITVPIERLAQFVASADDALERMLPGVRLVTYGHVGDGNLHYNLSRPASLDDASFVAYADQAARAIYDQVTALGGSISAEHGIGAAKREYVAAYKDPVELTLMRTIKSAIDPQGMMNPGKVV